MHLTLHVLGDVDAALLPRLGEALSVPWEGCELVLDRAEVWPGGIAVLEAAEVPAALQQLHAQLAERLLALGLPVETRWAPVRRRTSRRCAGRRGRPTHWCGRCPAAAATRRFSRSAEPKGKKGLPDGRP
jgi:2'-5' RNA ligase